MTTSFNSGTQGNTGVSQQTGTTNTNTNQTGLTAQSGNSSNVYTGAQQGLQQGLIGALQNTIASGGQIPNEQNLIPGADAAYATSFNEYSAPSLAATGGAGSPALAANLAMGLQNLNQGLTQTEFTTNAGTYNNALNNAGNTAFNSVGQNTSGTTAQNQVSGGTTTSASTDTSNTAGSWQSNNNPTLGATTYLQNNLAQLANWLQ